MGHIGTGLNWWDWKDNHLQFHNQSFKALSSFLRQIDFVSTNWQHAKDTDDVILQFIHKEVEVFYYYEPNVSNNNRADRAFGWIHNRNVNWLTTGDCISGNSIVCSPSIPYTPTYI